MSEQQTFESLVGQILQKDDRYHAQAYQFVRESLDYTFEKLKDPQDPEKHVNGKLLLKGIREYALDRYGPMTKTLFDDWSIHKSEDFGRIVFNMVDVGIFGKTDDDSLEDFKDVYDFHEAFEKPFLPVGKITLEQAKSLKSPPDETQRSN